MSESNKVISFIKNMSSGKVSVILAIVFFIWTARYMLYEKTPELLFEITSVVNIIDINKPLEELSISFRGEDIEKNNQNLRIYTLRIENIGELNILQDHYDKNDLWGFEVTNGRIIELRLVSSNSDYMYKNIAPTLKDKNIVKFTKVIFDKEKYFILEVLILHDKDLSPVFHYLGKIAGLDEVKVTMQSDLKAKKSFLQQIYDVFLSTLRPLSFAIVVFIIFRLISTAIDKNNDIRKKKQRINRRIQVETLLGKIENEKSKGTIIAREVYILYGIEELKIVKYMAKNRKKFTQLLQLYQMRDELNSVREKYHDVMDSNIMDELDLRFESFPLFGERQYPIISRLFDVGIVKLHDKSFKIDPDFKKTVDNYLSVFDT